jgi:hypothetical protein
MVRSLIVVALGMLTLMGCAPRWIDEHGHVRHGTVIAPPPQDEKILHVSTAYAYAPEKVEQGPFDKRAARDALAKVDVSKCGGSKEGHAKVTFAVDGTVSKVDVDWPSDLPPAIVECVRTEFTKARVLAFDGQPITLGTSFRSSR